ncbi:Gfo/Idh/MocA family protein [Alkalilimnicola ehrlichii]|uniref:Gfo/Idh/MocA family protein n=1 Tax=Alkalilimnicola ehrlichii TaxID=351052 RepID=UPI003BA373F3
MTGKLRCAVVGTGHLGRFHADKYAALPDCELVAVVDVDEAAGRAVADKHGVPLLDDHRALLGQVDAVSVAAPTSLHYRITRDLLSAGVHVLVEKPITTTLDEADELIELAHRHGALLQVGHLERFNAALMDLDMKNKPPRFIECHRLAPFKPRATDVSVVLDLMIHDIDIILSLVNETPERIDAKGVPVLTQDTDIANARLQFPGGCVANVTASRVSMKVERKVRLFLPHGYVSVDFQNRVLTHHRPGDREMFPGIPEIISEESVFEDGDALMAEIRDFTACIREGRTPLVDGHAGRRALATAIQISEQLQY